MMTVGLASQADWSMFETWRQRRRGRLSWSVACTVQPVEKLMTIAASALTPGQRLAAVVRSDSAVLYGTTQYYLPPSSDFPTFTPAKDDTQFSDPRGMQGWVVSFIADLCQPYVTTTSFLNLTNYISALLSMLVSQRNVSPSPKNHGWTNILPAIFS